MAKKSKVPEAPKFGTREWVANALLRKFAGTPERPPDKITSVSEYLLLKELEQELWPDEVPPTEFIWFDPADFSQPDPVTPCGESK
jgi:hypothetical protein